MKFNVSDFRANISKEGLAKPANFRVMFTGGILKSTRARALVFLCNQASIPGRSFGSAEFKTHHLIRKFPNSFLYEDLALQFFCTSGMAERSLFEEWQNQIGDNITGQFNYIDNYTTDITVEQFNDAGEKTYAIRFIDAFPITVGQLSLDWSSQNSFHNLPVTFTFKRWQEDPLPINPFGGQLSINSLFPNFDIGGLLNKTGIAILSRADGQIATRIERGVGFVSTLNNSLFPSGG